MTFRIRIPEPVIETFVASGIATFKRLGDAADDITRAADAMPRSAQARYARRSLRSAGAAAWASLLGRLTNSQTGS